MSISEFEEVNVYNTYASTFTGKKTIEITTKHPILCFSINNMWGKNPDNHQQASGTCWEKGGFGWGI